MTADEWADPRQALARDLCWTNAVARMPWRCHSVV